MITPNTAAKMTTIRTRAETGMAAGRALLNWYIADPGGVGTFETHANVLRKTHNSIYDITARHILQMKFVL